MNKIFLTHFSEKYKLKLQRNTTTYGLGQNTNKTQKSLTLLVTVLFL